MNSRVLAFDRRSPTPGAPEKQIVRSMFDRIAPRYDLLNRVLSGGIDRRWRRAAIDFLELGEGALLLDLCTGTADLMIEAVRRRESFRGAGVDLSQQMLRRGRSKLLDRGLAPRAWLASGDAERLPLRGAAFDGATIAFGIRNVGDPEAALREAHRVLKPGGRLVVLEFSTPKGALGAAYQLYFRHVLPRLGALVSGDATAYRYLPDSVARFPGPEDFGSMLERAGFRAVTWRALSLGIAHLHRGQKAS